MTAPVFSFDDVSHSRDGDALSCRCVVAANMPCFDGHFPDMPIMPAAAQLEMIQSLLQQHTNWNAIIAGGSALKFSGRILPGTILAIRLQRTPSGTLGFSVVHNDTVVTKGTLQLAGGGRD